MQKQMTLIVFPEQEKAELQSYPFSTALKQDQVLAETLYSWVSAGTETTGVYSGSHAKSKYPAYPGYSSVSRVIDVGPEVKELKAGDIVLGGRHSSYQLGNEEQFNRIDPEIDPRDAAFIHMFKIPLPSFIRTQIRGPEKCIVTGLGLVGLCAAQLAQMLGYEVYGFDVNPKRRAIAERHGIQTVDAITQERFGKTAGLGVDCSGHEQAILDLAQVIRRFGEIALVGVPWKRNTDLSAKDLLHAVFYNFLTIRSGWEWDMPDHQDIFNNKNFEKETMRGMQKGFLKINPADYELVSPEDPQTIYQNILHNNLNGLGYMLDWTGIN